MRLIFSVSFAATVLAGCGIASGPVYGPGGYHQNQTYPVYPAPQHHAPSSNWLDLDVGAEDFTGGDIISSGISSFGTTNEISYDEAYKTGVRGSAGFSTDVAPRTTILLRGTYRYAEAKNEVFDIGQDASGDQITGGFSDYESYGAEIGFREYGTDANASLRPYLGASVGATYVESISLIQPATTTKIYDGGWVPTASGMVGLELPVSRSGALAVETGLRFEGNQERAVSGLGNNDDRYSVPVTLRGRFRF